ncbi:MAG: nucleotidyltransferase domain-containing protein [bacterium]
MKATAIKEQRTGALIPSETISAVIRAIAESFSPQKIILFGSYASGHPTPDSDLDLLVIMESDLPRHKRAVPIRRLFRPTPCAMDILVYTPQEAEYWNGVANHIITEVFETGKVVYERPNNERSKP